MHVSSINATRVLAMAESIACNDRKRGEARWGRRGQGREVEGEMESHVTRRQATPHHGDFHPLVYRI